MGDPVLLAPRVHAGTGRSERVERADALVGAEPITRIVMMENHDDAYHAWRRAGVTGRILLHLDAHIDWDWIAEKDPREILSAPSLTQVESILGERCLWNLSGRRREELVHIGNYIYPAIREGIVREFCWVVPDADFHGPRPGRDLVRIFRQMVKVNPREFKNVRQENRRIVGEIFGRPVSVCRLSDLPQMPEPVLLDIDTDFLLPAPEDLARSGRAPWRQLPWIWPEGLVRRLSHHGIRTDFVTVAYSVEGGYTPLLFKYLGDEVALRLRHPTLPEREHQVLRHKQRGAVCRAGGDLDRAIAVYEEAVRLMPEDASAHFNLAYLYDERGAFDQAAARYRQAVALDSTYATPYNTFGPVYLAQGILDRAEEEYRRILRWDPGNVDAHLGLAEVFARGERWDEAVLQYQRVREFRPGQGAVHRPLGYVHLKQGRWDEAINQFIQAIAVLASDGRAHFWLGEAYSRQRRWHQAIEAYRGALRCGMRNVAIHMRLGRLYRKMRAFHKALNHYRKGIRLWARLVPVRVRARADGLSETLARGFDRVSARRPALEE